MMKFLRKNYIKLIIILVLMIGVPIGIDLVRANFEYQYETISAPPKLYVLDKNGNKIELVLASYTIDTLDQTKEEVIVEDYYNYDFKDNNKLISFEDQSYEIVTDSNINFENYEFEVKDVDKRDVSFSGYSVTGNKYLRQTQEKTGEYLNIFRIYTSDKSFYGTYIYKELIIESSNVYKNGIYNISLSDENNVKNVLEKIKYNKFLNSYKIENDMLILEYNLQLPEKLLKEIAKSLFVCINDLNEVKILTNKDANIKTEIKNINTYDYEVLPYKNYTFKRDELNLETISIQKIKEYLGV